MARGNLGAAALKTVWAVGWRVAALLAAVLCFKQMVDLRDWQAQFAVSKTWAGEVAKEKGRWAPILSRAALTMTPADFVSKEAMFEEVLETVRKLPAAREDHLTGYQAAIARQENLSGELETRVAEIDKRFGERSRIRVDFASGNAKAEAEVTTLAADLATINAERAAIEFGYSKQLDPIARQVKRAEDGLRAVFEEGAKYARPVTPGPGAALLLHIGDATSAWHILYVLLWYGLEALVLALLFATAVRLLLAIRGAGSKVEQVKTPFMERVTALLGSVLGPRAAAALGKAVATLAIGAVGVVGLNAIADDPPAVGPVIAHHQQPVGGEKGEAGAPAEIPSEIARMLEEQAAMLKEQALTLAQQKELIDLVNKNLGDVSTQTKTTAASAEKLAAEAETMATNMTGLAATASTTGMTLGTLNNGMSQMVEAQRFSLVASSAAARQLNQSVTGLQLATAQTASGVTQVATQAAEMAKVDADLHATSIQVSAIGDGFLRPINPFYSYKLTPEAVETVLKATNRSTLQAAKLEDALRFMRTQKPMRGRAFRNTLRNNTDVSAHALLDQLMPLILKVSCGRGGNDVAGNS